MTNKLNLIKEECDVYTNRIYLYTFCLSVIYIFIFLAKKKNLLIQILRVNYKYINFKVNKR